MVPNTRSILLLMVIAGAGLWPPLGNAYSIQGLGIVQDDGSLLVGGQRVQLFGIYMPPSDRQCDTTWIPIRCANRSVVQLNRIAKGFLYCDVQGETATGQLIAICYQGQTAFEPGQDLGAYLVQQGWALATPDAPFEYHALEKLARTRELGLWGWSVDSISKPPWRGRPLR